MSVRTILSIVAILSLSLRADLMEARKFARKAEMQMRRGGYKIVSTRGAKLRTSEDKTFRVMLYRGNSYAILGYGESSVKDLDVQIYDREWRIVKEDYTIGSIYAIHFRPKQTGVYYINTTMYRGSGYFFLSVGWR
ncbi:MAG: hypothetical protein GXO06_04950 [Epsilonproteobacteria bacterium]|nr:hypothetical protein [Campylobacterota bacterium]